MDREEPSSKKVRSQVGSGLRNQAWRGDTEVQGCSAFVYLHVACVLDVLEFVVPKTLLNAMPRNLLGRLRGQDWVKGHGVPDQVVCCRPTGALGTKGTTRTRLQTGSRWSLGP